MAAANALKESSDGREMLERNTPSAEHRASSASDTGALPLRPLATMDSPRALMAGDRKCSSDVPTRDGRTPTQAPHMRESDVEKVDMCASSLAGMKFRAHSETTSHSGQLRGRETVKLGLGEDAREDAAEVLRLLHPGLGRPLAALGCVLRDDSGRRKMRSAGYPGHRRFLARHCEQLGRFPSHCGAISPGPPGIVIFRGVHYLRLVSASGRTGIP